MIYCCVSAEPRLHTALVSPVKVMCCIQCSVVVLASGSCSQGTLRPLLSGIGLGPGTCHLHLGVQDLGLRSLKNDLVFFTV